MAQLTDDCFAFSGPLLPIDEVERILRERVMPVAETETVPLDSAYGRVMASDVTAPISLPPFDNSAVDGYAVRAVDLDRKAETKLAISGRATAGHAATQALAPGAAIRIFTGAPMPAGADTVFMQEDVRLDGEAVLVPPGLDAGANRRLAGEDVQAGAVVLPAGRRLRPARGAGGGGRAHATAGAPPHPGGGALDRRRDRRARSRRARERRPVRCQPLSAGRPDRRPGGASKSTSASCRRSWRDGGHRWPGRCRARSRATSAACRPAKPTMCARRSNASAASCSGALPSNRAGRSPWA